MRSRSVQLHGDVPGPLADGFARLRTTLDVPGHYPDAAVREAERAVAALELPDRDLTHLAFVTIDPQGSTDLDQAVHLARTTDGYLVHYAIADLVAFVVPGTGLDEETHRRGVTLYAPHERTPLHPVVIAEEAASLLAGQTRPALVWTHRLDTSGVVVASEVVRARVRSRAQLSYREVQDALDAGTADAMLRLLAEVGALCLAREAERGGVSLPIPEQEVHETSAGWSLSFRVGLPVEQWNAQISLMTGMAAARMMLAAGVGILRTLPPITPDAVARLRRIAGALGVTWRPQVDYPEFVRTLDPSDPRHAALLNACTSVFRGAGYVAFEGAAPTQPLHGALNAPYAHCTAPLRRLVDRYVGQICLSVSAGEPVPRWVTGALPSLPDAMAAATRRASAYERGIVDLVEALVLTGRVGESFPASVIEWDSGRGVGEIQLTEPAVVAPFTAGAATAVRLGSRTRAVLTDVDLEQGRVRFVAE